MQAVAHDAVEGGDLGARGPLVAIRPPGDLPHEPAQIAKGGQRLAQPAWLGPDGEPGSRKPALEPIEVGGVVRRLRGRQPRLVREGDEELFRREPVRASGRVARSSDVTISRALTSYKSLVGS